MPRHSTSGDRKRGWQSDTEFEQDLLEFATDKSTNGVVLFEIDLARAHAVTTKTTNRWLKRSRFVSWEGFVSWWQRDLLQRANHHQRLDD